ncbi:HpcH/HpaI aldolase/citrate lyase family protein [Methylophilus medardicus]|uniref:Aldolase n=1 Tax=Methylophilus medardicus TaxID=2588534 RepID=A0A5B8CTD9_9PROT|nr:aldolase/citrate lyase family protein [Methylophilus medardicus]QDC44370.1 aldolase [Methylophilus medardicus]QDC49377.1 aldolase [Methylophilus medardicus]QDC53082.1 aldolase [Methylophilus medardicus]
MSQHMGEEPIALDASALGDYWPGIQLYYPPVKYAPSLGIYEDMEQAANRMVKHAHFTNAHTLIFDLEDGCRQKEMSRTLLRQELPKLRKVNERVTIAIRANSFRTDEYEEDMKLVRDMGEYIDVVMLAKAGESYGAAEVRDLSSFLLSINPKITIQPIIEHPKSLKIAPELMQYDTVKHVVFGIHDFSKALGIHITPEHWIEELFYFINQLIFEARIAGKGVIGGVETLIGSNIMPDKFVEPHDVRRWLDLHGDHESRVVYKHACQEAAMGLTGKQVIHPGHIHLCKTAYTPSPTEINQKVAILKAAIEADALLGGAIKFEGEMLDPPMFGKALQTLLRAHALRALKVSDMEFALHVLQLMPAQVVRQNWPYGILL